MRYFFSYTLLSLCALSTSARADDIFLPGRNTQIASYQPRSDETKQNIWTGFYLGGMFGHTKSTTNLDAQRLSSAGPVNNANLDLNSSFNTITPYIGASFQYHDVVIAVEGEVAPNPSKASFYNLQYVLGASSTLRADTSQENLMRERLRLGYTALPSVLIYASAGLSQTKQTLGGYTGNLAFNTLNFSNSISRQGENLGLGAEYIFFDHLLFRFEYIYDYFNKKDINFGEGGPMSNVVDKNVTLSKSTYRGGVSYKF
jgi:opacity protein-like surface antigen